MRSIAFSVIASLALFSCACGGSGPVADEERIPEQEIPDQVGNDENGNGNDEGSSVNLTANLLSNV